VKQKRERWREDLAWKDPRRFVFLDESSAKTNMTRLYGRASVGQRVHDSVPTATWHTTTMLAAVEPKVPGLLSYWKGLLMPSPFERM